jgi:hypothetical protein
MKIAFDIGGVLSRYPNECSELIASLGHRSNVIYAITDMHDHAEVVRTLRFNHFHFDPSYVFCADFHRYGDACKAVLLRDLGVDIFVDDHPGYLVWPWPTPAPRRLRVEPDPRRPYWHPTWRCEGGEFGRRCYMDPPGDAGAGPGEAVGHG